LGDNLRAETADANPNGGGSGVVPVVISRSAALRAKKAETAANHKEAEAAENAEGLCFKVLDYLVH
jgi:hypothetical protein